MVKVQVRERHRRDIRELTPETRDRRAERGPVLVGVEPGINDVNCPRVTAHKDRVAVGVGRLHAWHVEGNGVDPGADLLRFGERSCPQRLALAITCCANGIHCHAS